MDSHQNLVTIIILLFTILWGCPFLVWLIRIRLRPDWSDFKTKESRFLRKAVSLWFVAAWLIAIVIFAIMWAFRHRLT